jgi:hypothetical protein
MQKKASQFIYRLGFAAKFSAELSRTRGMCAQGCIRKKAPGARISFFSGVSGAFVKGANELHSPFPK